VIRAAIPETSTTKRRLEVHISQDSNRIAELRPGLSANFGHLDFTLFATAHEGEILRQPLASQNDPY
jgi:hypothetical protein